MLAGESRFAPSPQVVCIGVAALDVIVEVDELPGADQRVQARAGVLAGGGVAATAAVTLRRSGVAAAFVGVVGDDEPGSLIRDGLVREGVDVTLLHTEVGAHSPVSSATVRALGRTRSLAAYPGSMSAIPITAEVVAAARAAHWVHVDHAGWAAVASLRHAGVTTPISLDGGNPISDLVLTDVDLYVPGRAELLRRSGCSSVREALRAALAEGVPIAIATLGEEGSIALAHSEIDPQSPDVAGRLRQVRPDRSHMRQALADLAEVVVPAFTAAGASTLGAGDVYHGALLAALVHGDPLAASMRYASAAAAISCRGLDGRSAIPTRQDVEALLGSAG